MKVVTASEMNRIEKLAYEHGASEEAFMDAAGEGVAELTQQIIGRLHLKPKILLLCGAGNNAGDAYVAGRILKEGSFEVEVIALAPLEESSPLCRLKADSYLKAGGEIIYPATASDLKFDEAAILVDGLFGTGFHGQVQGLYRELIEKMNQSKIPILAIDIPSGINGNTGEIGGIAVQATYTISLGLPKKGCFIGETWCYVGQLHTHDFGLPESFVEQAVAEGTLIEPSLIHTLLPTIHRTRHKFQAGYVVGWGGSLGMPGAAMMASEACLRAGAGYVRLMHPKGMEHELSAAPYELVRQGFKEGDEAPLLEMMGKANAVFIGPAIGTHNGTLKVLKRLLPQLNRPCVIDADALTHLANAEIKLPSQTILTPHHGEMKRLLHQEGEIDTLAFHQACQRYCDQKGVTLVLKGAPTFIFHPHVRPYICAQGDPGMATAGSGDVLTGILSAFLARVSHPLHAAILGVYFHARAGEIAAEEWGSNSMVATDITAALPHVFHDYV